MFFLIDWLSFGEGRGVRLKLDVQGCERHMCIIPYIKE